MALAIEWVIIDCVDVDSLSTFWQEALDLEHVGIGPSGGHKLVAKDGSRQKLGLIPVPEGKTGKNRLHLDLRPDDQLAEIERLERLGATRVEIGQPNGGWIVMADPEGNEFCVLQARSPGRP